jgi:hypothetical protein
MGIDYTTYIGPHVRCKTTKVPSTKTIRTCSDAACANYGTDVPRWVSDHFNNFCGKCGSPIQNRDLPTEVDNVNPYEVRMDLLNESLCDVPGDSFHFWMRDNNVHIWIANVRVPDAREFSFDSEANIQYVPMNAELIAKETDQFSSFYEKELAILREEYGAENVEVQWGLIHYIS